LYYSRVPLRGVKDGKVEMTWMPFNLPHEVLAKLWQQNPADFLHHQHSAQHLPPLLRETGAAQKLFFEVYTDGVGLTKRDSFTVWYVGNVFSPHREVVAYVRKCDHCPCGCKGQHTLQAIEQVLALSCAAAATGMWPLDRLDDTPFTHPTDSLRAEQCGTPLFPHEGVNYTAWHAGLLGDLKAHVEGLGLPHYAAKKHPCFICHCRRRDLYSLRARDRGRWRPRTPEEYTDALQSQVFTVSVLPEDHAALTGVLAFSATRRGQAVNRGNAPICQRLGLETGDLLLPGGDLKEHPAVALDVTKLRQDGPSRLRFFRASAGILSMLPAWAIVPGFELPSAVRLDVMHVKDLGVTARWIAHVVQRMLDAKAWPQPTGTTVAAKLYRFYRDGNGVAKRNGKRLLSRLPKGTGVPLLTGKGRDRICKAKAAENRDLVGFLVSELQSTTATVKDCAALLGMGEDLLETYRILKEKAQRHFPREPAQAYLDAELRFLKTWRRLKLPRTIKHHMAVHLAEQALTLETHPAYFDTFRDETFNRKVKAWAHGVSTVSGARLVLARAAYMRSKATRVAWVMPAAPRPG